LTGIRKKELKENVSTCLPASSVGR